MQCCTYCINYRVFVISILAANHVGTHVNKYSDTKYKYKYTSTKYYIMRVNNARR